jgi:hypothetical protein
MNGYAYAADNPVNGSDPSGMNMKTDEGGGGGGGSDVFQGGGLPSSEGGGGEGEGEGESSTSSDDGDNSDSDISLPPEDSQEQGHQDEIDAREQEKNQEKAAAQKAAENARQAAERDGENSDESAAEPRETPRKPYDPSKLGSTLPEYVEGRPTEGVAEDDGGTVYRDLVSGKKGQSKDLIQIVNDRLRAAFKLGDRTTSARASDLEQKFGAYMVQRGIRSAKLMINNPTGPCLVELGCEQSLGTILGEDGTLTVYWPDGMGGWNSGAYGAGGSPE